MTRLAAFVGRLRERVRRLGRLRERGHEEEKFGLRMKKMRVSI